MPSSPERRSISNTKAISQPPFEQTSVAAACANKCKNEVKNKQPQATESSSTTNSELGCSTYPDLPPLSISQRHFVQIKVLLKERREDVNKSSPIDDFFHNFPKFKYNPRQHPIDAYYRLAEVENWEGDDCTNEYPSFYNATREEFMWQLMRQRRLILVRNVRDSRKVPVDDMREGGGGDETLKGWERLCLIMDRDIPATPEEAEADLQGIFVNIYDLIHQLRIDRLHDLCHFANLKSLADYSYQTGKIYPWREAEGSTILEFLLRPLGIFKPKSKKKRGGQRNGRWAGGRHHGGRDRS
ncbi:hypothetical protein BDZ91DRAFT_744248 [Kalaharituber pfeilii]|nr:hypothetical protein BDZ91DRAFT_744248 [Kalaharituber pfeilii]